MEGKKWKKRLNFKKPLITLGTIGFISLSVVSTISFLNNSSNFLIKKTNVDNFIADPTDKNYYAQDCYVFDPDFSKPTLEFQHGSDYLFQDPNNQNHIYNLSTEGDPNDGMENVELSIHGNKLLDIKIHNTPSTIFYKNAKPSGKNGFSYDQGSRLITIPQIILDHFPLFKKGYMKSPTNQFITRDYGTHMIFMKNWNDSSIVYGPTSYLSIPHNYHFTDFIGYKYAYKNNFYTYFLGARLGRGVTNLDNFQQGFGVNKVTTNFPSPFDQIFLNPANYSPTFTIGSNVNAKTLICKSTTPNEYNIVNFTLDVSDVNSPILNTKEVFVKKTGDSTFHKPTSTSFPKVFKIDSTTYYSDSSGIYILTSPKSTDWELTPIYKGAINSQVGMVKINNHYLTQKIDGTNVILDDKFQDVTATKVADRFVYGLSLLPKISYGTHGWYNTTQLLDLTSCDDKLLKWGNTLIPLYKLKPMKYKDILHDTMWSSYFEETFEELDKVPHAVDPNQKLNATLEYSEDDGATWKSLNATSNIALNKKYLSRLNVDNVDKKACSFHKPLVQNFHIPFEVADYSNLEIKSKFIQYKPGGDSIIKITPPIIKAKQNTHYEYALYDKKSKTKKTEWTRSNFISIKTSDILKTNFIRIRESYNDLRYPILESRKHPFAHSLIMPINVDASKFIPTFDSKSHNMTGHNLTSYNNVGFQFKLTSAVDSKDTTWDLEMPKHLKPGDIIQVRYINLDETKVQIFGEKKGIFYVTDSTIFGDILAQIQVDASKFTPTFDKPNKVMKTSNLTSVNGVDIFYSVLPLGGSETTPTKTIPTDKLHKGDLILARYVAKDPTTHTVTGDSFAKFVVPDLKKHITVDASKHNPKIDVSNNMTDSGITIPSEAKIEYALQKKSQTKGSYSETLPTALHIGDIIFFKLSAKKPDDVQLDGKLESHWTMKETINVDASTFAPTIDDLQRKMTDTNIKEVKGTKIQYRVLDTNAQPLTKFSEDFPKDLFNKYIIEMKFIPIDIANIIFIGTQTAQFTITSIKAIPIFVDLSSPNLVFMSNGDLKLGDNIKNVENLKLLYQVYDEKGVLIQKYSSKIPNNLKFGFSVQVKYESAKKDYLPTGIIESSKIKIEKFNTQDSDGDIILYGSLAGGAVFIGLSTFTILTKLLKGKKIDRKML